MLWLWTIRAWPMANATEEEVNVVIESFDSQRSQTRLLASRKQRIGILLGRGGVKRVEDALALDGKSLADATDEEVNAEINTLRSVCPGIVVWKKISTEEESQDESSGNKFYEQTANWRVG